MSQVPVKKYKKYSHQDLLNAVATVKQSGMPILQAAKYFNIPRKTLSDHLKGKQKGGWSTYLDVEKEKALVEYALYMGDNATPVTRKGMMEAAGNVNSKYSQKHFTNGVPTQGWWHGFKQRHPELSLRSSSNVDGGRCAMSRASVVEKHFDLLGKTLLENNLLHKPHRIFNSDETGFGDKCDSSRERGIFRKGSKFPYHRQVKLRDHISVNYCASATGMIIPPLVIFEKTVPVNAEEKGPAGAIYRANESGFMSEDLYLTWFSECFIPNCGCDPDIPVILIQDNHSTHMGYCLREKAIEHNILIYNLPAHSSHILQKM